MKYKKLSFRTVLALLACAIVLTSTFSYIVFSNPSLSFTTVVQEGSMVSEADYIIFRDGSTYYAKNGRTGAISFSSTNATLVIQNSIDALPITGEQSGGLIHFHSGVYVLSASIEITECNINVQGAGRDNTKLVLANGANCDVFSIKPLSLKNFISIRDLSIDGNKNNQAGESHGISIGGNVGDVSFTDLYIDQTLNKSIYVQPITRVWNLWILDNLLEGAGQAGIMLDAQVDDIDFCHIRGNYIHQNKFGIHIKGTNTRGIDIEENVIKRNNYHGILLEGARYINIEGNQIFDNSELTSYTYDGIYLGQYNATEQCYYMVINDNIIGNQGLTNKQRYGINIADSSDDLEIIGNQLEGNHNASIYINSGAAVVSEIHYNIGFRTEYFGTCTISASTYVDQPHYLNATPIIVNVTPQSDINCTFWVTDVGATTFRVNIADSQTATFFWEALYRPT